MMNRLLTTIFLLLTIHAFGQKKNCFCDKDSLMDNATVSCDTKVLSNGSKLYWQYNCDKIWLTLENPKGIKYTINNVPVDLYGYTYRLGFHFIKEFKETVLFRSGCPANGSCIYTLIDKNTGRKMKEFDQLICIDTDAFGENPHEYEYDFVVYFSKQADSLTVHYIDSKKRVKVPFNDKLKALIPQHRFDLMTLDRNMLTLFYESDDNIQKTLRIDLSDKTNYR